MGKILLNFQCFDDIGCYHGNQELIFTGFNFDDGILKVHDGNIVTEHDRLDT